MGANFYKITKNLIIYKDQFKQIKNKKFTDLIKVLNEIELVETEDGDNVPSNTELAKILNLPQQKVNLLLRALYEEILNEFQMEYLPIKECKQTIYIGFPYDEIDTDVLKRNPNYYKQFSKLVEVKLAVIPRVGERINLEFENYKNDVHSGYVHDVEYTIDGYSQNILIRVHPLDKEYARWEKLKKEYEDRERWRRQQRSMKD